MERAGTLKVVLALLTLYVVWGGTYLGIRIALEGFPPLLLAGSRFVLAGAVLLAVLRARGAALPTPRGWAASAAVGTLLLGANGLVSWAEVTVSSSVAAIVISSVPLWIALASGLFGEWPARREWLGIAVGLGGVVLLQSGGELRASPSGALLLVLSTWCWAFGSMWSRRLPMPDGLMASAAEMLCGGTVLLAGALVKGERLAAMPGPRAIAAWAYLVVFGSLVAFSAYVYLLRTVRPALATSYAYVNPVVAVALGALAGERIPPRALAALALILLGVAAVASYAARRTRAVAGTARPPAGERANEVAADPP